MAQNQLHPVSMRNGTQVVRRLLAAWHRGSATVWPLASCSMFVQPLLSPLLTWVVNVLLVPRMKLDPEWTGLAKSLTCGMCYVKVTHCCCGISPRYRLYPRPDGLSWRHVHWKSVSRCPRTHPGPIAQGAASWASLTVKKSSSGVS